MYREPAIAAMREIFAEIPYGVEHTLRVLDNAEAILAGESITDGLREIVTLTAILHDTGAVAAMRKYGSIDAPYQEKEGPATARQVLESLDCPVALVERVCYIIGHHHTPEKIDGPDFQVQWEADLLDNLAYGSRPTDRDELERLIETNFKTVTGLNLARQRFLNP